MTAKPTRDRRRIPLVPRVLSNLWTAEGSVGQKAVRGAVWVIGSMGVRRLLAMVQTVILVRLLVPGDFGIMGIVAFVLAGMEVFTETGMGAAVIQRKEVDEETLDTAWTIGVIRHAVLFLAVFAGAPYAASFYGTPLIGPILRLVSVKLLLEGFVNVGVSLLRKELDFRRHEFFVTVPNALNIVFTVALAFFLRNVWALAIGQVALAIMTVIGSYIAHPYRPRIACHRASAFHLLRFGRHVLAMGIVVFLRTQLDDAILGKMLGMDALGLYALAYALSNLPATWIMHTVSGVAFPAYSKLQDDPERLAGGFLKVLRLSSAISLPAAAGLFVLAGDIVGVVYGENYAPMTSAFRVLCVFGAARSLGLGGPVFMAIGRPYISTYLGLAHLVVMLALIYPLTSRFSIMGTAWSTTVPALMVAPPGVAIACRLTRVKAREAFNSILVASVASMTMMAAVHACRLALGDVGVPGLGLLVGVGVGVYCFCMQFLAPGLVRQVKTMAGSMLATLPANTERR